MRQKWQAIAGTKLTKPEHVQVLFSGLVDESQQDTYEQVLIFRVEKPSDVEDAVEP